MKAELRAEVEESQERMFKRFEAMLDKQNSMLLQTTGTYERQFDRIFQALDQDIDPKHSEVAARPRDYSASGEKT